MTRKNTNNRNVRYKDIIYEHILDLSQMKYEEELRRENSLIQQSSNMQTAFSFMAATVLMALPILIENRGKLTFEFLLSSSTSILLFLMISLFTASLAQRRLKKQAFMNIEDIEKAVKKNAGNYLKKYQRVGQKVHLLSAIQKRLTKVNDKRVTLIRVSMLSFWVSLVLILFWFVTGMVMNFY